MYPLNDNDLDRLSREAAEQYDVQPGASGWEALEKRLNRELPLKEEKERRRFLFWLFLIVLLAGGGLLWTMTGKNNNTLQVGHTDTVQGLSGTGHTTPVVTAPAVDAATAEKHPVAGEKNTQEATATTVTPPAGKAPVPTEAASARRTAASSASTRQKERASAHVEADNRLAGHNKKNPRFKKDTEKIASRPVDDFDKANANKGEVNKATRIPVAKNKSGRGPANTGKTEYPTPDAGNARSLKATQLALANLETNIGPIQAPPLAVPPAGSAANAPEIPKKKNNNKNKGFEIGLTAGPDMSNVKFTDMDKVGYNAGLQIGYRFSDRWLVNTGLLYTRKNYTVQGKDWTKSGWWRYTDIHTVEGYCQMFDIPLNVRYDFAVNKKQRWYASAGASSYIMNREYYNYDYTYNGIRRQANRESDSTTTYLFSILNLSAGFERALNKRFSIQAEPYFKFPLKGLGYGKLDLNSYGIYFSVKYKFSK